MQQITVVYNVSIDDDVQSALEGAGIVEYTRIPRCQGVGRVTGPRRDDAVWPGFNAMVLAVVEDGAAPGVLAALQALRETGDGRLAGLFAWSTPVLASLSPPH